MKLMSSFKSTFKIKILTILVSFVFLNDICAQAPEAFNYQGIALDAKGVPVVSKKISLRISIFQRNQTDSVVFQETHSPTTDKYGQFSLNIGLGVVVKGRMSAIQFHRHPHYIKSEMDIAGGSSFIDMGTTQLLSVPYAINATTAGNYDLRIDSMKTDLSSVQLKVKGDSIYLNNNRGGFLLPKLNLMDNLNNLKIGQNALLKNKTGNGNVGIGVNSLALMDSGSNNIAIGNNTLTKLVVSTGGIGSQNIAIGMNSLMNSVGNGNTALGVQTLQEATIGSWNTAVGVHALAAITTGSNNVAVGYASMIGSKIGASDNVMVGRGSGQVLESNSNVGIGLGAMHSTTIGFQNTAVGATSLYNNTIGSNNVALGSGALYRNQSGGSNTAIGNQVLYDNTAPNNTAVGFQSQKATSTGSRNTSIGVGTMQANTTGSVNNAFGYLALNKSTTASENNAFGHQSMEQNTTGSGNSAFGHNSLQQNLVGNNNTAIGYNVMNLNTADNNTSVGWRSLQANVTGTENVALGEEALTNSTGSNLAAFGAEAGKANTTGSNNTFLGAFANLTNGTLTNAMALGYNSSTSSSNTVSIGNSSTTKWALGIPTTTNAGFAFQVGSTASNGNGAYLTNGGTWTNASSRNFKENFEDIDGGDLLKKIESLKILKWNYKGTDELHIGPIAEDFKQMFDLGVKNDETHISTLDASGIALRAVQELNEQNKKLKQENKDLKSKYESLEQRLFKLENLLNQVTTLTGNK